MVKTCKLCKKEKPIEEFNRRFTYRDNQCRSCRLPTLRGGRPCIYPWNNCVVGGSFIVSVGPAETPRKVQHRIVQMTQYRKRYHSEKWQTKQLWKAVKVTRLK